MFVVKCPKCAQLSKAFADHANLPAKCPHCRKRIVIQADPEERPAEAMLAIRPLAGSVKRKRRKRERLPDTSPPALTLSVAALLATWSFYTWGEGLMARAGLESIWHLLVTCQWVGNVEVFLFVWGLLLFVWKATLWMLQRRPLRWNVIADCYSGETRIHPADVGKCLAHVEGLARRPRGSLLLNRVWLALEHFQQTRSVQEVRGALTGQSAIDANLLDSSYAVIRFLIWVIPIMGFVGTVLGIGVAVSQFADFIPQVSEVDKAMASLREGLGRVTGGLATAFNTTLVALCMAAPLMLMMSGLKKLEERLLAEIDQFSNHSLLGVLDDTE